MKAQAFLEKIKSSEDVKLYHIVLEINNVVFKSESVHTLEVIQRMGFTMWKPPKKISNPISIKYKE